MYQTGFDWIPVDVSGQSESVRIRIHQATFVATLEKWTHALIPEINVLSVPALECLHGILKVGFGGLEKEVVMVLHQAIREQTQMEIPHRFCQECEEGPPVFVVSEDGALLDASVIDVIERTFELDTPWPRHEPIMQQIYQKINDLRGQTLKGLTPEGLTPW